MAKMTLERAEAILAKARSWYSHSDMTDVQFVRKMETLKREAGFTMAFASLTFMKFANHKDWTLTICLGFFFAMAGFAAYMIIESSRFSKIRRLFENAGPQNLKDLSSNQNPTTDQNG